MKNYFKQTITLLAIAGIMGLTHTGCASSMYKNPAIFIAYPTDNGLINDQSEIASIVVNSPAYGVTIDNVLMFEENDKIAENVQVINNKKQQVRIIDVLPGKHKLSVTYKDSKTSFNTSNQMQVSRASSKKPIEQEVELKAGEIYLLQLGLMDVAHSLMTLKKPTSDPNGLSLKPLPENYKKQIKEFRKQQK